MSNRNGVWSLPAQYQAIADQDWTMAPGAPTGVSASAGNAQAEVSFTAPTFAGIPGTITQFKVTSSSGQTATGSASPITVTGLTNGSGVTFTAQAQNAIGLGKASDASSSVTPLAVVISGLFSTHLYLGNNTSTAINNGINLSGKGGLVWTKNRDDTQTHFISDTERGATKLLSPNNTDAQETQSSSLTSFNNNGFTVNNLYVNNNGDDYVSWTFRKQPKFFDVVTYTGTGPASAANEQQVSHNLGVKPGLIIIKRTDDTGNWWVFTDVIDGTNDYAYLNSTNAFGNSSNNVPTTSVFNVGGVLNTSSATYVAYLFANNNSDGGFGPDSEDIIKIGTFASNSSGDASVTNLGFEPQWLMTKRHDGTSNWALMDIMRGYNDSLWNPLYADANNAESSIASTRGFPTSTGFEFDGQLSASANYIYMAIRRGGMATPTVASEVFSIDTKGSSAPYFDSNHIVDMALVKSAGATGDWYNYARLMGEKYLATNTTAAEANASEAGFDFMDGHIDSDWGGTNAHSWMWKRAKGYFDVVAYTGTGAAQTINHNLGAIPEMIWLKRRDTANFEWIVYHKGLNGGTSPEDYVLYLNTTNTEADVAYWDDTAPTSTTFRVSGFGQTGANGGTYIAYLFATVAGVSKLGSYTGNGSSQTIDCGFTNGSKFVLIKRMNDTGHWQIWDTTRGLVDGNDTRLILNGTGANLTGYDMIDPHNSGFSVPTSNDTNENNKTYLFYAIANDPS